MECMRERTWSLPSLLFLSVCGQRHLLLQTRALSPLPWKTPKWYLIAYVHIPAQHGHTHTHACKLNKYTHKRMNKTDKLDFFSQFPASIYFTFCKTNYLGLKSKPCPGVLRGPSWNEPIHIQMGYAAQTWADFKGHWGGTSYCHQREKQPMSGCSTSRCESVSETESWGGNVIFWCLFQRPENNVLWYNEMKR